MILRQRTPKNFPPRKKFPRPITVLGVLTSHINKYRDWVFLVERDNDAPVIKMIGELTGKIVSQRVIHCHGGETKLK
jgi:hypothetical protein